MKAKHLTLMEAPTVAWTGGSAPCLRYLYAYQLADFKIVRSRMFREQVRAWAGYWLVPMPLDIARIFWNRATHNAWATARSVGWVD